MALTDFERISKSPENISVVKLILCPCLAAYVVIVFFDVSDSPAAFVYKPNGSS
jgi:hypothetical protein